MIGWYIAGGMVALLALLLFLPLTLTLKMDDRGQIKLCFRLIGIPFWRVPEKNRPVRLSDYSPRAMEKRRRKQQKQAEKQARREQKRQAKVTSPSPAIPQKEASLSDKITFVSDFVSYILAHSLNHARLKVTRLAITVATPDAAQTAMLYGALSPAFALLLEVLDHFTHLNIPANARVGLAVDFCAEHTKVDIHLRFRWHLLHVLHIAWYFMLHSLPPTRKTRVT